MQLQLKEAARDNEEHERWVKVMESQAFATYLGLLYHFLIVLYLDSKEET